MNDMHEANRRAWDRAAEGWRALRDRDAQWQQCPQHPELAFEGEALDQIRDCLGTIAGKDVCVVGSGDNYAAFALAGCGARVTSVDISQRQLDVAAERAAYLGLDICFARADAADLAGLADESFDLVTSTNGFYVWIAEPRRVHAAIHRVLRRGGSYVFYDVHPFQRPWSGELPLAMVKPYWSTGPFPDAESGSYEFTWTLADLLNPLMACGFCLRRIAESPPRSARFWHGASYEAAPDEALSDWRHNALAGLPVWLTVAAQKP
jgi:SAM-dependent methyltransferase